MAPNEAKAAVAEFCDAEIDCYPVRKFAEANPCHGREECSQFLVGCQEAWSHVERAVQDLIQVSYDRVRVCANRRAEGRGSRAKLEAPSTSATGCDTAACFG